MLCDLSELLCLQVKKPGAEAAALRHDALRTWQVFLTDLMLQYGLNDRFVNRSIVRIVCDITVLTSTLI